MKNGLVAGLDVGTTTVIAMIGEALEGGGFKVIRVGNHVSHAHNRRRRRWLPNLQRVRVVLNGTHRRMRVCTDCLSLGRVQKIG